MAKTFSLDVQHSISLGEFIEYCETEIDHEDESSICEAASNLLALSRSPSLLVKAARAYLEDFEALEASDQVYTSQCLMLATRKRFSVRAVMWVPPQLRDKSTDYDNALYAYGFPHNHNFSLLTVGLLGPGYWADIYDFDPSNVIGYEGERVNLSFLERTSLPVGKVMLYRKIFDAHTQSPPESFSVSLNLLSNGRCTEKEVQFSFDTAQSTIRSVLGYPTQAQMNLLRFAEHYGSVELVEPIMRIAKTNPAARTRAAAYRSLCTMVPADLEKFTTEALSDPAEFVKHEARNRIELLSSAKFIPHHLVP